MIDLIEKINSIDLTTLSPQQKELLHDLKTELATSCSCCGSEIDKKSIKRFQEIIGVKND